MTPDLDSPSHHKWYEDIFAIFIGTTLVSLGIAFYAEAQLTTGSSAGLALLLQYMTGIPFGWLFFAINLPFYALAFMRMGLPFTVKTVASVALVSSNLRGVDLGTAVKEVQEMVRENPLGADVRLAFGGQSEPHSLMGRPLSRPPRPPAPVARSPLRHRSAWRQPLE